MRAERYIDFFSYNLTRHTLHNTGMLHMYISGVSYYLLVFYKKFDQYVDRTTISTISNDSHKLSELVTNRSVSADSVRLK